MSDPNKRERHPRSAEYSELLAHVDRAIRAGKVESSTRVPPGDEFVLPEVRLTEALRKSFARVLPGEIHLLSAADQAIVEKRLHHIVQMIDCEVRAIGQWILEQAAAQTGIVDKAAHKDALNRGRVLSKTEPMRCSGCGKLLLDVGAWEKHWQWGWVCRPCARLARRVPKTP